MWNAWRQLSCEECICRQLQGRGAVEADEERDDWNLDFDIKIKILT